MAKYARMHNNSNVLTLGADELTVNEAICILRIWIATEFEGGRHEERIKLIEEIEKVIDEAKKQIEIPNEA